MNTPLWWEGDAWSSRLIDFLSIVDSFEKSDSLAEKFIAQTVKQNVRYEGRGVRIPASFLLETYNLLGTPSNGTSRKWLEDDSPATQAERGALNSPFELWHVYTTLFAAEGAAEQRARALLSSVEWTDAEVFEIVRTLARAFHREVPQNVDGEYTLGEFRVLVREIFSRPDAGNRAPWDYLACNPHLTRLVTEGGLGYYDNLLAGILDATRASPQAYAFKAIIGYSWNPNPHMAFVEHAYQACSGSSLSTSSSVTWARTATKNTMMRRHVAQYKISASEVEKMLETKGKLSISEVSAALLLRDDNEEACRLAVSYLLKKKDWEKLTYFTPAISSVLASLASELGDSEGNIPVEWVLEVLS